MPISPHRHESESEAKNNARYSGRCRRQMQHVPDHNNARTNEGGDCVKLSPQYSRYFPYKYISHHAATDSGQHAEECGRDRAHSKGKCFTGSGYRKQCQSGRVEYQDWAAEAIDDAIPEERNQAPQHRNNDLTPVADRCRRKGSNHHIARDPT